MHICYHTVYFWANWRSILLAIAPQLDFTAAADAADGRSLLHAICDRETYTHRSMWKIHYPSHRPRRPEDPIEREIVQRRNLERRGSQALFAAALRKSSAEQWQQPDKEGHCTTIAPRMRCCSSPLPTAADMCDELLLCQVALHC